METSVSHSFSFFKGDGMYNLKKLKLVFLIILIGCGDKKINYLDSMTVFCGSANKPAMEEIAKMFEKEKIPLKISNEL